MRYIITESKLDNVIKKFIKKELSNYISYDKGNKLYRKGIKREDILLGEFVDKDGKSLVKILVDMGDPIQLPGMEFPPKYAEVNYKFQELIEHMFSLPTYKTFDLIAQSCSEILGMQIQYAVWE